MKKSKFTETQIIAVLKQGDAGVPIKDLCRQAGISSAPYYQWNSKYGGMVALNPERNVMVNAASWPGTEKRPLAA